MSTAVVVARSFCARAVLGLCVSTSLVACGDVSTDTTDDANTMLTDLPTSNTAVRIALFGEGNKAPADAADLRVWPAWIIVENGDDGDDDNDVFVFDLAGDGAETRPLTRNGETFPTVDLEFGAPPAAAMRDEGDGGQFAQPMALVLDVSVDATTLGRLGELPGTARLGLSNYLGFVPVGGLSSSLKERGFAEGLNDQTTDNDGEPSKVAFVAVATAAGHFELTPVVADYLVR